jgi:hypothetical protein
MTTNNFSWGLMGFSRSTGYLEDIVDISPLDEDIKLVTGLSPEEAVDSYEISLSQAKELFDVELDSNYDWFLESKV